MKYKDEMNRLTHKSNDEQFAQKQEEICHFIQDSHPGMLKTLLLFFLTRITFLNPFVNYMNIYTHLIMFLMRRKKASLAEVQKFLP